MPTDPSTLMQLFVAAVLLPVATGWALGHRFARLPSALAVAITGGLIATWFAGPKLGLLAATWCLGLAYLATSRGFIPDNLRDMAESAKDAGRHG